MVKTIGNVEGEGFVTTAGASIDAGIGLLGEIRQIALSMTGALSKATLQGYGWAICDGTTPASQGISDATITTTPDLREKFLRHSANETTGGTGGGTTHNHQWGVQISGGSHPEYAYNSVTNNNSDATKQTYNSSGTVIDIPKGSGNYWKGNLYTSKESSSEPPYYDICYFLKVK